jgi:hypothetical protein
VSPLPGTFSTPLAMIYSLTIGPAFLLVGALLLSLGGIVLAQPRPSRKWLQEFPRSRPWGLALLALATGWAWYLIYTIDLGEFDKWRRTILYLIPLAGLLTALFVDELLAARALGMVLLLAAEPLLEAGRRSPDLSPLFLITFTYLAIIAAMFWIGMPYLLRDQIRWASTSTLRLRAVAAAVAGFGALLLILGLTLHR